jgi:5-methyltetrahydrofolate--homocysteine methyltransferase
MRNALRELAQSRIVILDGATGTELRNAGMPAQACPEMWVLEHPDSLVRLQQAYRAAGSDIVYACTFGANRFRLRRLGIDRDVRRMNQELAQISRRAVGDGWVFGDMAPSGDFIEPLGDVSFDQAVAACKEQVRGLVDGGVDGFVVETMVDIQEARAAIIAIRELSNLPIIASITLDKNGRCLTGTDLLTAVVTLQSLGADAVGCNCSTGPADMISHIRKVKPHATVPLLAKPNAGMPSRTAEGPAFDIGPEEFAAFVKEFVRRGANLLGGCCGTNPDYIRRIKAEAEQCVPVPPRTAAVAAVTSVSRTVLLEPQGPLKIVGERINPTGKPKLQQELRDGRLSAVRRYAREQSERGADLLDVNVSAPDVDEVEMMQHCIRALTELCRLPLCIDTTHPAVLERALQLYAGRALVNSISAEREQLETNLPIAARYGAMIIALPMSDDGLPQDAATRIRNTERIVEAAAAYGYPPRNLVVDGMLMATASHADSVSQFMQTIDWVANTLDTNSICGLSNCSFGLPGRSWINAAMLSMAVARGLSMTIANPQSKLVMAMKYAADLLCNRDECCMNYIRYYRAVLSSHSVVQNDSSPKYEDFYQLEAEPQPEPAEAAIDLTLGRRVTPD